MARPHKQTVDYFPHDTDASEGKTLTIIQNKFGNDGYAFWFKLLQLLGKQPGLYYDFNNPEDWEFLLAKTHLMSTETAKEILNTLQLLGAIDKELYKHGIIWSQNFVDRVVMAFDRRKDSTPKKPEIPVNVDNNQVNADNNSINPCNNPQRKVKESKGNNNKENITRAPHGEFKNVFLSDGEHGKLLERFGAEKTKDLIESLSLGIQSKGYKFKDYYATILNWERRDNGKNGGNENGRTGTNPRELPKVYTRPDEL
jgi:hypothetical protein